MIWNKRYNGYYINDKYQITKRKSWWTLYSRDDGEFYDVYCGIFKSCKEAMKGAELLDRCDRKARWSSKLA